MRHRQRWSAEKQALDTGHGRWMQDAGGLLTVSVVLVVGNSGGYNPRSGCSS